MRLKEVERTAVQVWSPAVHHPVYLATGTSAQQLDASFSTNASLEIFEVDFGDPSVDMKNRGVLPFTSRFHKLIWGSYGIGPPNFSGVIVGGGDNGLITLYSASQILTSGTEPVIGQSEKHTGPVRALDFNPFQSNLLASGANDSEIYIWDLNNFSVPMTPGSKTQPSEDICTVAWNRQVQHILSSAHPSGKAVVWDLRKNEPIIKVSDHSNRMHCSGMLWHPEVPTQLVLSSEDDRMPVIQIWDLRFATSPLKMLESHTRGILSISWCQADPELLLSSAKDNRILCWNPSIGEVIYELPTKSQWCFDVQWCPRNPCVFSAASFDGWINVYSIMGGSLEAQQTNQAGKISSSFNTMDPFGTGQPLPPLHLPQQVSLTTSIPPLKKPPRWICRPVGVSFAFGGKLITFGTTKANPLKIQQNSHEVFISQVITEEDFLSRSRELQTALISGNLLRYCQNKIHSAQLQTDKNIWNFLKVNFEQDARTKFLKLLGYNKDDLEKKISSSCLGVRAHAKDPPSEAGDYVPSGHSLSSQGSGNNSGQSTSTSSSPSELFSLLPPDTGKFEIPVTTDTDGLICQSLLVGNFKGAVELCLNDGRFADAIILAIAGGEKLLRETQQRYFSQQKNKITSLLSSLVQHNWRNIVLECNLQNWKEALAILLTYSKSDEYAELCDVLGARLESEGTGRLSSQACLCYISSGNVTRLVECWVKTHETASPLEIQDLVEKVMVLRRSIELLRGTSLPAQGPVLHEKLTQYANLLASQGSLAAAMSYLPDESEECWIQQLRDRLFHAQGEAMVGQPSPPFPFPKASTAASTNFSSVKKGSLLPQGSPQNGASKQASYQSTVQCQAQPQPSLTSLFTPQPLPSSIAPTTGMPYFGTSEPQSVYSRPGALPVYPQNSAQLLGLGGTVEGWNDPPSVRGGLSWKKVPDRHIPPVPITTPVMNVHFEMQGIQKQALSNDSLQAPPGAPTEANMQQIPRMPVERIEKKALPQEHKCLKSTFEGLVQRCSMVASDPKTKRKLDDAYQRLEALYDKLREQTLSPYILSGLHEIARCIEDRNYQQGLIVHTQVVSNSNFSEISSFMPILKIIMTLATKLCV
ncbi:protein transport protein Sec31B isoform X2 [Ambystoma mexicanum]|uniref:protein transport protein Sec31B isoform X2 n=1 Tax=Ambystoma mexicanum TaxID=8296 RepID=UPI0037E93AAF